MGPYRLGKTPARACAFDQRFTYCLYVPRDLDPESARILIAIHGTERANQEFRDAFVDYADANNLIVLAPLFPGGIIDPDDLDNYKYIEYEGIRFDHVVLHMIGEVESYYGLQPRPLLMFGFSGGAHFSHRFLYLYPQRLEAVSICSPGSPTLLDLDQPWWIGVADMEQRFGRALDLDAIRRVDIHLAVGGDDTNASEIIHQPGSRLWMPGANDGGATRVERLASLAASLKSHGVGFEYDVLPGVRHDRAALVASAIDFFDTRQEGRRNVAA